MARFRQKAKSTARRHPSEAPPKKRRAITVAGPSPDALRAASSALAAIASATFGYKALVAAALNTPQSFHAVVSFFPRSTALLVSRAWRMARNRSTLRVELIPMHKFGFASGALVSALPHVLSVSLQSTEAQDADVITITEGCRHLEKLNLRCCRYLTCAAFSALASGCCPNLAAVNLLGSAVGDTGVIAISEGCPALTEILLERCAVGDAAVIGLAGGCRRLLTLELGGTESTNKGVNALARGCASLRRLVLAGCSAVSDNSVIRVATSCSGLRELDVSGTNITEAAIIAVARECRRLEQIQFECCHAINCTEDAILALATLADEAGCLKSVDARDLSDDITNEAWGALRSSGVGVSVVGAPASAPGQWRWVPRVSGGGGGGGGGGCGGGFVWM